MLLNFGSMYIYNMKSSMGAQKYKNFATTALTLLSISTSVSEFSATYEE